MALLYEDVTGGLGTFKLACPADEFLRFSLRRFAEAENLSGWLGDNRGFSTEISQDVGRSPGPSARTGLELAVPLVQVGVPGSAAQESPSPLTGKVYSWTSGTHIIEDASRNPFCIGRFSTRALRGCCFCVKCCPSSGDPITGEAGFDVSRTKHRVTAQYSSEERSPPSQQTMPLADQPLDTGVERCLKLTVSCEGAISHVQPFAPSVWTKAEISIQRLSSGGLKVWGLICGTSYPDMELVMQYRGMNFPLACYHSPLPARCASVGLWLLTNRCHMLSRFELVIRNGRVDLTLGEADVTLSRTPSASDNCSAYCCLCDRRGCLCCYDQRDANEAGGMETVEQAMLLPGSLHEPIVLVGQAVNAS